jgi:hypothetical protein
MKMYAFLLFVCAFSIKSFGQQSDDFRLRYRPGSDGTVFSVDDLKQLASQGATLEGMQLRLNAIDEKLKDIRTILDKEVLPTIYVMDFFKWLFGAIIVAIIGVEVNARKRTRRPHPAT